MWKDLDYFYGHPGIIVYLGCRVGPNSRSRRFGIPNGTVERTPYTLCEPKRGGLPTNLDSNLQYIYYFLSTICAH